VEEFKRNTIEPAQPITVEAIQATPVNKVPPRPYVKDDSTDLVTERKIRKLPNAKREPRTISRLGVILSLIGVSILAASIYYFLAKDSAGNPDPSTTVVVESEDSATERSERITDERGTESINPSVDPRVERREPKKNSGAKTTPPGGATGAPNSSRRGPVEDTIIRQKMVKETVTPVAARSSTDARYRVKSRAYFHNEPDESTRRNAFIVHWNKAILSPLNVENDFVYIVFTNHLGQTSKGWLRLQDLVKVED
ncbi:MAG TPA: hypothetical protein VEY06_02305, partial [Flavisolibacter sp.]|nr:hypothetical protein [Flavisolibacter sp.]